MKTTSKKHSFKFSAGTDPENPVFSLKENRIVSAINVLNERDKYTPISLGDGYELFADNVMVEQNIPPSFSRQSFQDTIFEGLKRTKEYLTNDYKIIQKSAHYYTEEEANHPLAIMAGCSPAFDARTVSVLNPPEFTNTMRSAGGHFNMAVIKEDPKDEANFENKIRAVRLSALFMYLPLMITDKDESAKDRRMIYSGAYCHRVNPWGCEIRGGGNQWLSKPELVDFMYFMGEHINNILMDKKADELIAKFDMDEIDRIDRESDVAAAQKIVDQLDIPQKYRDLIIPTDAVDIYQSWNLI